MAIQTKMTIDQLAMVDMFFQPNYDQPLNYVNAIAMKLPLKVINQKMRETLLKVLGKIFPSAFFVIKKQPFNRIDLNLGDDSFIMKSKLF